LKFEQEAGFERRNFQGLAAVPRDEAKKKFRRG